METRPDFAIKAENEYKAFIVLNIKENFKTPADSTGYLTIPEILSYFRGDHFAQRWFETELKNLGYEVNSKGEYKIDLLRPFTGLIKIKE